MLLQTLGNAPRLATKVVGLGIFCTSTWAQPACEISELIASGGGFGDQFGRSVSVSGDRAVIGATLDDDNGIDSGSAYVYRLDGNEWVFEQHLVAPDGGPVQWFGVSVSISGNVVVVGAIAGAVNGVFTGSAYVYRHDGRQWIVEQKLRASDGEEADRFGGAVAIEGDVVVVGAFSDDDGDTDAGAAYVFRFVDAHWTQEQKLVAPDAQAGDNFGFSVSIHSDTIVSGAPFDDDNGDHSGAAYVFRLADKNWTIEQKLTSLDNEEEDHFGGSVSAGDEFVLVGAEQEDDPGLASGSAYVFKYDARKSQWLQDQQLLPDDIAEQDRFGIAVALTASLAIVGSYGDDGYEGSWAGSAYLFARAEEGWSQVDKLTASAGGPFEAFGAAVAADDDAVIIGAFSADGEAVESGKAYAFSLSELCLPLGDLDGDGLVGTADLIIMLGAWGPCDNCDDCAADLDGDCLVGTTDLVILLGNWG